MLRALVVVLVGLLTGSSCALTNAPEPPPLIVDESADSVVGEAVTVHVAGAVVNPGLVIVAPGSRVADAVAAAGGAAPDAALGSVNLATPLRDGDQVLIPHVGGPQVAAVGDGRLSLNRATASELETLPGVGPVTAQRIVAHREANGPFSTVEDLLDVTGIGEAKLAAIRDAVVVP